MSHIEQRRRYILLPFLSGILWPRCVPARETASPLFRHLTSSQITSGSRNEGQPWALLSARKSSQLRPFGASQRLRRTIQKVIRQMLEHEQKRMKCIVLEYSNHDLRLSSITVIECHRFLFLLAFLDFLEKLVFLFKVTRVLRQTDNRNCNLVTRRFVYQNKNMRCKDERN